MQSVGRYSIGYYWRSVEEAEGRGRKTERKKEKGKKQ